MRKQENIDKKTKKVLLVVGLIILTGFIFSSCGLFRSKMPPSTKPSKTIEQSSSGKVVFTPPVGMTRKSPGDGGTYWMSNDDKQRSNVFLLTSANSNETDAQFAQRYTDINQAYDYINMLSKSFESEQGFKATNMTLISSEIIYVDSRPAWKVKFSYGMQGHNVTQTQLFIKVDKTYIYTFTQFEGEDWATKFEESINNFHVK